MNYKNLFSCRNKVAVVIGGLGLIGKQIVRGLSDNGATVYVADNASLGSLSKAESFKLRNIYIDISSEDSVRGAFNKIANDAKKIDILVNSAYPRTKDWANKLEDVSFESWKCNMNSQLGGLFLCCREAVKYMKKQRRGSIINIGSIYGVVAPDFSIYDGTEMTMPAAYSAIKAGLINFTRYLAVYYGKYNIRANAVSPGGVFDNQPKKFVDNYCRKVPLTRMAKPSDIVGAVVFLSSDASSYLTGHNLMVDGGWTAW